MDIPRQRNGRVRAEVLHRVRAEHVAKALDSLDDGAEHAFAESIGYDLVARGRRYSPKAVLGIAAQFALGQRFVPDDFAGGEHSTCFSILRGHGYEIVAKSSTCDDDLCVVWNNLSTEHIESAIENCAKPPGRTAFQRGGGVLKSIEEFVAARSDVDLFIVQGTTDQVVARGRIVSVSRAADLSGEALAEAERVRLSTDDRIDAENLLIASDVERLDLAMSLGAFVKQSDDAPLRAGGQWRASICYLPPEVLPRRSADDSDDVDEELEGFPEGGVQGPVRLNGGAAIRAASVGERAWAEATLTAVNETFDRHLHLEWLAGSDTVSRVILAWDDPAPSDLMGDSPMVRGVYVRAIFAADGSVQQPHWEFTTDNLVYLSEYLAQAGFDLNRNGRVRLDMRYLVLRAPADEADGRIVVASVAGMRTRSGLGPLPRVLETRIGDVRYTSVTVIPVVPTASVDVYVRGMDLAVDGATPLVSARQPGSLVRLDGVDVSIVDVVRVEGPGRRPVIDTVHVRVDGAYPTGVAFDLCIETVAGVVTTPCEYADPGVPRFSSISPREVRFGQSKRFVVDGRHLGVPGAVLRAERLDEGAETQPFSLCDADSVQAACFEVKDRGKKLVFEAELPAPGRYRILYGSVGAAEVASVNVRVK